MWGPPGSPVPSLDEACLPFTRGALNFGSGMGVKMAVTRLQQVRCRKMGVSILLRLPYVTDRCSSLLHTSHRTPLTHHLFLLCPSVGLRRGPLRDGPHGCCNAPAPAAARDGGPSHDAQGAFGGAGHTAGHFTGAVHKVGVSQGQKRIKDLLAIAWLSYCHHDFLNILLSTLCSGLCCTSLRASSLTSTHEIRSTPSSSPCSRMSRQWPRAPGHHSQTWHIAHKWMMQLYSRWGM